MDILAWISTSSVVVYFRLLSSALICMFRANNFPYQKSIKWANSFLFQTLCITTKCLKTDYFRFVALICLIYALKVGHQHFYLFLLIISSNTFITGRIYEATVGIHKMYYRQVAPNRAIRAVRWYTLQTALLLLHLVCKRGRKGLICEVTNPFCF